MRKFLLLLISLFLPITVHANVKVESHLIDSEIEIAGALNVKELIIVEGEGSFIQRTLNYYSFKDKHWELGDEIDLDNGIFYNAQSISITSVAAYEVDDEVSFGSFEDKIKNYLKEFDINNPEDTGYTYTDKDDGTVSLKIFYPVKNKRTAFYINYVVSNAVVKHNDVKEINYTFKNLNINSNETYLRVIIPYQTDDEEYNVWVHGNQSGEVHEIANDDGLKAGIIARFPKINESINFRMTLPQKQVGIDLYLNNSEIDALDSIKKIEDKKLDKTNKSNRIVKIMKYVLIGIGLVYVVFSFVFLKLNIKAIYIIYLLLGLFICLFNYLFKFNYWYLYLVILFPILIKLLKKYIVK